MITDSRIITVITANGGTLKAYRLTAESKEDSPTVEEIASLDLLNRPAPMGEAVSDQAGRFPTGGPTAQAGGMAYGEHHHTEQEQERRRLGELAETIHKIISQENSEAWGLACPKEISGRLVDLLDADTRSQLQKSITSDLTKSPRKILIEQFW